MAAPGGAGRAELDPALQAPAVAGLNLASGLRGSWRRVRRPALYRVSIILVAAAMMLIPLIYLGLIAGIGWLMVLHARHDIGWITHSPVRGRAAIFVVLIYIVPFLVGLSLIGFMIKPMLAPRRRGGEIYTVQPFEEPVLYAFVEMVCRVIGAPAPKRIDIDCDVNASAGFRGGLFSLMRRGDLVLTIGMPLVAGLNLNQFAGVLAHEFGHFSQGAGMRAYYLTYSVNSWLARLVYQRDGWDWRLEQYAAMGDSVFWRLVCQLMRLGVWLTRQVFKVLLFAAHALSAFMARQMEFDADRHQARFAGSDLFAGTAMRIAELNAATPMAITEVRAFWKARQLPDDVPSLVADAAGRLPLAERERVAARIRDGKAGVFDTHPSMAARIRRAERAEEEAVFRLDGPASVLFRNFLAVCRRATYGHYKGMLDEGISLATLVPTHELLRANARTDQRLKLMSGYVGVEPPDWRPLFLRGGGIAPAADASRLGAQLKDARARLARPGAAAAAEAFSRADAQLIRCDAAESVFAIGAPVVSRSFGLAHATPHGLAEARSKAIDEAARANDVLDQALEAGAARIAAVLGLLQLADVQRHVKDAPRVLARARELVAALGVLREAFPAVARLRSQMARVEAVSEAMESPKLRPRALDAIRKLSDQVRDHLDDIRRAAGAAPWPYDTPQGRVNTGQRLVGASPGWRQLDDIFRAGRDVVDRYPGDVKRITAELVEIAAGVERAMREASERRRAASAPRGPG